MSTPTRRKYVRTPQTVEERAEQINALSQQLTEAVKTITTDEAWISMLKVAAQFHHYSLNNVLLLWMQAEARGVTITQVAGFQKWISLGRHVIKGSRGFKVFAPRKHRLTAEEAAEIGPSAYDSNGRPKMVIRGFKVEHVFDIAQTEGEPLPDIEGPQPTQLTGDGPEGLWTAMEKIVAGKGYEVRREQSSNPEAYGSVTWSEKVVRVRPDVDEAQACKTLIHECGHIEAKHETRDIGRAQKETEAESVAFIVGQIHGLDTTDYSAPYVAHWSTGDPEIIRAAAQAVHQAAQSILSALEPEQEPDEQT